MSLDLLVGFAGLVSFGIYPKQAPEQVRYLLEHSEAKIVFVDEPKELETVLAAAKGVSSLTTIVPWTQALYDKYHARDPRIVPFSRFEEEALSDAEVRATFDTIDPDGVAILIYTSGTTGPPKGAMISHRNILTLLSASQKMSPFYGNDLSLNFLPMAHSAERVLGFYGRVAGGVAGGGSGNSQAEKPRGILLHPYLQSRPAAFCPSDRSPRSRLLATDLTGYNGAITGTSDVPPPGSELAIARSGHFTIQSYLLNSIFTHKSARYAVEGVLSGFATDAAVSALPEPDLIQFAERNSEALDAADNTELGNVGQDDYDAWVQPARMVGPGR